MRFLRGFLWQQHVYIRQSFQSCGRTCFGEWCCPDRDGQTCRSSGQCWARPPIQGCWLLHPLHVQESVYNNKFFTWHNNNVDKNNKIYGLVLLYLWHLKENKHVVSYWFAGLVREFYMEVQLGLSWDGWSEYNLQFDAFKRSNLPIFYLREGFSSRTRQHLIFTFFFKNLTFQSCIFKEKIILQKCLDYDLYIFLLTYNY